MATPVFMQIVEKSTNYKDGKSRLKLFETSILDIIRKIKAQSGDTLSGATNGDYISDSLMADIRTKQEQYKINFSDYVTEIIDYVATDPRADISSYLAFVYTYSAIDTGIIEANDDVLYEILRQIMNNEGYFHERRVNIKEILWYIRNIIVDTKMFGYYEINPDNYSIFESKSKDDLILDDIYNVLDGGDTSMILEEKSVSLTGNGSVTTSIDSDEILYSVDRLYYDTGVVDANVKIETKMIKSGSVTATKETIFIDTTLGPGTSSRMLEDNLVCPSSLYLNAVLTVTDASSTASFTMYYTTRKIIKV